MLLEEQTTELLKRCESFAKKELWKLRGELSSENSRAAAIWELLVIEATAQLGKIEYEPTKNSPDIKLYFPNGGFVWIEVAYLYPRYWREERVSQEVTKWIFKEVKRRGIDSCKITYRLDGDQENKAGPVRTLPNLNERKHFLYNSEFSKFLDRICAFPNKIQSFQSNKYSISLRYLPGYIGPLSGGGLQQESPKTLQEHQVYRILRDKAYQHKIPEPHLVCIGSDQSPALSRLTAPGCPTKQDAIMAALYKHCSLSGVITVQIESYFEILGEYGKRAHSNIFINSNAKHKLTKSETDILGQLDFNRWNYSSPLKKWDTLEEMGQRRATGKLTYRPENFGMEIEIPANIVVDALAGKTNLIEAYKLPENDAISQALKNGWAIESCSLKNGHIEAGETTKIVFNLVLPPLTVYGASKEPSKPPGRRISKKRESE